ncbi:MAG: 5-formyltetrahydrofolate cyclo-ligase [Rhizobiaceae bacterium]|nr:5-formyltetrahydrofolate cyclo-ligase [Rhizobiaceae bacterium]
MISKALKAKLRAERLAARDAISGESRIEKSMTIAEAGADLIDFLPGQDVSGFFPIRSEVDVRPLMQRLRERGARLSVPVVVDRQTIVFRELVAGAPLVSTGFGTFGPGEEALAVDPDVMLVPLAAFDRAGHRIGYGAGYYDRAIARLHDKGKRPRLVGIAFDCQEIDIVPAEDHDIALDAILTESGFRVILETA